MAIVTKETEVGPIESKEGFEIACSIRDKIQAAIDASPFVLDVNGEVIRKAVDNPAEPVLLAD